jgi:hypothetical protein
VATLVHQWGLGGAAPAHTVSGRRLIQFVGRHELCVGGSRKGFLVELALEAARLRRFNRKGAQDIVFVFYDIDQLFGDHRDLQVLHLRSCSRSRAARACSSPLIMADWVYNTDAVRQQITNRHVPQRCDLRRPE